MLFRSGMATIDTLLRASYDLQPQAVARDLQMRLEPAPEIMINGDRQRLRQLFYQLVHNALQFTPAGGQVRLLARAVPRAMLPQAIPGDATQYLELSVIDNGPGIPDAARIDADETAYLCEQASRYFARPVVPADVVWAYSGVLPWKKGVAGVKWRDMDEATFEQGFWSWITGSYTVRIGHRFTKASEIVLTDIGAEHLPDADREHHLIAAREQRGAHDHAARAGGIDRVPVFRLDLDPQWMPLVKELGVTVSIGPDAHETGGFADLDHGVAVARRAATVVHRADQALRVADHLMGADVPTPEDKL